MIIIYLKSYDKSTSYNFYFYQYNKLWQIIWKKKLNDETSFKFLKAYENSVLLKEEF